MAFKRKITKDAFEKLIPEIKAEYKEKDGNYVLDVEKSEIELGHDKLLEDNGNLKRGKDREALEAKELREKLKAIEDKNSDADDLNNKKKGDIEALEKSWNGKLETQKGEFETKLSKSQKTINKLLVNDVANNIANDISLKPNVILPHIKARLGIDNEGDDPKTRVLDKDGKPSAMTVDELKQEFKANTDFSGIIKGTKGSGGGANGGNNSDPGSAGKSLKEMSGTEEAIFGRENPDQYAQMVAADPERQGLN